jgi:hypothetical protein
MRAIVFFIPMGCAADPRETQIVALPDI